MMNVVSRRMVSRGNTSNVTVTLFDPLVQPPGSAPQRQKAERELKNTEKAGSPVIRAARFRKSPVMSEKTAYNRLFDLL